MTSQANALQKAVWQALTGSAALSAKIGAANVHDRQLPVKDMPYLLFGALVTTDYSTASESLQEHRLTIEAWSAADGRAEVQEIADLVRGVLHNAALTLGGAVLVNLQHEETRVRREGKTRAFVAVMGFRAVTE